MLYLLMSFYDFYKNVLQVPTLVTAYAIVVVCICLSLFACYVLQPEFATSAVGGTMYGPRRSPPTPYSIFYYNIWPIL
jgi:hypothetical protein